MLRADNVAPSCAVVTKSGDINFLEPSGPLQACNGTDLPLPLYYIGICCIGYILFRYILLSYIVLRYIVLDIFYLDILY